METRVWRLLLKKNQLGIGFNNIGYVYDQKTRQQITGIRVVPLDLNNNGKIDPDENFYNTLDDLVNAIAIGKYPSPPARDLYFVTKGKPTKPVVVEFIRWALTEGQVYIKEAGYIELPKDKLMLNIDKLK